MTDQTAKVAKRSGRGSRPGEHRGGRKPGTPNKATASLKELARQYTDESLTALIGVIRSTESDAARVSAIKEMLDRGYGKASQVLAGDEEGGPIRIAKVEWNVRDAGD